MAERRRGYAATLLAGLLAATAVTVGVSRPWASATARVEGLPVITVSVSGADLAPLAGALGVVLLAAFGAVIATAGWVRRCLGALVVVAAAVVVEAAVAPGGSRSALEAGLSAKGWTPGGDYSAHSVAWRWLVLAGGGVCAVAGAAIGRYGARWATMGAQYDAPTAAPEGPEPSGAVAVSSLSEADLWRAIDRGHDPTQAP